MPDEKREDYPEHLTDFALEKKHLKGELKWEEFYTITEYNGRELRQRIYDEVMSKKKKATKKVKK